MQYRHIGWQVKGLYRIASVAFKEATMDDTAVNRKRILDFLEKYGEKATIEAFQVSRRTLYAWRAKLLVQGGNIAALKAKHAAIRKANAALLPATLERMFAA